MTRALHWFRNDLRLRDNTALVHLTSRAEEWLPVFIFDERIVGSQSQGAARTRFMLDCLERLARDLEKRGIPLLIRSGRPEEVLPRLAHELGVGLVTFNSATTPFARERDDAVERALGRTGVECASFLDHVIFGARDVRTGSGGAYAVYTPYRKTWWKHWNEAPQRPARLPRLPPPIPGQDAGRIPTPCELDIDLSQVELPTGGEDAARRRLTRFLETGVRRYHEDRDRPDLDGTSRLSPYIRFGVLSVRECFERAREAMAEDRTVVPGASKWLDELVWREFYAGILEQHPRVLRESHRREYETLEWNDDRDGFEAWCEGRTGFPFVDAAMRQLRETGWMHNRARMVVASFLTKDLLIDWREGARFFFGQLVDGDPASNNGGWQWAASTGTDAQPYFRIFNPITQGRRFDPHGDYVRRWVPELRALAPEQIHTPWEAPLLSGQYPAPIVDHAERRVIALERFRAAREGLVAG